MKALFYSILVCFTCTVVKTQVAASLLSPSRYQDAFASLAPA